MCLNFMMTYLTANDQFFGERELPLVLITNRKSHMSFPLVPNSVTLDDLEWRNSPSPSIISISPNSVGFGTDYVEVVEDTPILSAAEK